MSLQQKVGLKKFTPKLFLVAIVLIFISFQSRAGEISDRTFLITHISGQNFGNDELWTELQKNNFTGIEFEIKWRNNQFYLSNSNAKIEGVFVKIQNLIQQQTSKILPVFITFNGNVDLLDSLVQHSGMETSVFYLPPGEALPTEEYLVQANRRILFFIDGNFSGTSKIMHPVSTYTLKISASGKTGNSYPTENPENLNQELLVVESFDQLPTNLPPNSYSRNLVPDYINFLLDTWKKYGKRPNFLFIGNNLSTFDFIVDQLNSFTWVKGSVKTAGKTPGKIYWKAPNNLVTGNHFSFPYRGGEELILSPFAPGFSMTPEQLVITGEMSIPEGYEIIATPLKLGDGLTGNFSFENGVNNAVNPDQKFEGSNFSFVQDIQRGEVLKLAEKASINLGKPENYGLRNSSFTVSCFVKFTDILEFGDNAILGNYEAGYRRGLHLILRSGHPYFGLWANDFISTKILLPNVWYHIAWRYIIETGEQAIFLNGQYIGSSDGHPPFSGTGDIHLGSALSSGASLRGYIDNLHIWNRPLGNDEINRLALDEEIGLNETTIADSESKGNSNLIFLFVFALVIAVFITFYLFKRKSKSKTQDTDLLSPATAVNQVRIFGEFKVIDRDGENITQLFTPKVKELFLFTLIHTLKSGIGASISEINEALWFGISSEKVANNRSVTLNKLRKILQQIDGIEMVSYSGYLQTKISEPFTCDYVNAYHLCQIPEGLSKRELVSFLDIVKRGRFLKGITWEWLDEIRGYTGNQVIDNLLNLATVYQKEMNLTEIEKIAQRILDYDDLNEEATYLQVWALQKTNNTNLAKYSFNTFSKKYESNLGEPYPMNFVQFMQHFGKGFN